jgi:hypothetical protein
MTSVHSTAAAMTTTTVIVKAVQKVFMARPCSRLGRYCIRENAVRRSGTA